MRTATQTATPDALSLPKPHKEVQVEVVALAARGLDELCNHNDKAQVVADGRELGVEAGVRRTGITGGCFTALVVALSASFRCHRLLERFNWAVQATQN